jgi:hypothetical protein
MNLMISNILIAEFYGINLSDEKIDVKKIKSSSVFNLEISSINPQNEESGIIYYNITDSFSNAYINRYQPSLNNQPNVYIPDYILSHANMTFENVTAINYTKIIEEEFSEFIYASRRGPTYIFQKFSVELSQYINNVSLFIQDICDLTTYTPENSWEVAIVNCSSDGTPYNNETLGSLTKPHPQNYAAHWEIFDFLNSQTGSIFLNTSKTNMTLENGAEKYWFAIRVKIPPDDTLKDGGPKFLYFNPDGGSSTNIGEGETFAKSPDFFDDVYFENEIVEDYMVNGTVLSGGIDSFKVMDNDTHISTPNTDNLTIAVRFEIANLTEVNTTYADLANLAQVIPNLWAAIHHVFIFSFDVYLSINVTNVINITSASIWMQDGNNPLTWVNISDTIDILPENDSLYIIKVRDPVEKGNILAFMNHSANGNNSLVFRLDYYSDGEKFNVSIDQATIQIGELENIDTVESYDPTIQQLYSPNNVTVVNGTTYNQPNSFLELNDDVYYYAQADTNNISVDFKVNLLSELNSSLWSMDIYEWIDLYPNPIVPQMQVGISANASVDDPANLTIAVLEVYKGNRTFSFLTNPENQLKWLPLTDTDAFAPKGESTFAEILPANYTWIFLQLLNSSDQNSLLLRLRFVGSGAFSNFNISIDQISVTFFIQNVYSSDIAAKLGFGLAENSLDVTQIKMQNFGTDILYNGPQNGVWEANITDGTPTQGFFGFNVSSIWPSIRFDVSGNFLVYKLKPLLEFIDTFEEEYMEGTNIFSVKALYWNGDPVRNIDIIFEVFDANGRRVSESTAITNDAGVASASVQLSDTGYGFTIRASFEEEGILTNSYKNSVKFRVVNPFTIFLDYFIRLLPYIIIIIAILSLTFLIMHNKKNKLREIWAEDALVLDDLLKISYVLIIHKDIGVSLYSQQVSSEELDSDLISGFLHAISQFRKELKKGVSEEPATGKTMEMDYYESKIVITDGNFIRVALILDREPSKELKEKQLAFTKHFEKKHGAILDADSFDGDVTRFRDTYILVEQYFNVSIMYPLQLGRVLDEKLTDLQRVLLNVAEQMEKEKNFFFISTLINYGIASRKESRDQIISAIFSLKERELIVPMKTE